MGDLTEAAKRVVEFTEGYLEDFGGSFTKLGDSVFYTKRGSALVRIEVFAFGDKDALVRVSSEVVTGAKLEPELLMTLLRANHDTTFGAFGISDDHVITLRHTLFGSTLDRDELVSAIYAVSRAADDWDDRIIEDFGGETALGRLQQLSNAGAPSEAATTFAGTPSDDSAERTIADQASEAGARPDDKAPPAGD